eukprot:symbB.v1.2.021814.t2/scaffold1907.1/size98186/6
MLEVLSAVSGETIAVFEDEEIADASVKALKQRLARKIGLPRFRLRLLQDNCALNDDQTFAMQGVQLVILEFLPPDTEQDQGIIVACEENDDILLEQQLNMPRSPNCQDADQITPLYAAASSGSLKCVLLLLEAGANKDQGKTDTGSTPLFVAAEEGHLEVVRLLVNCGAKKDQGTTYFGATPLYIAAYKGHLEVVRFLVESGANKDQGTTTDGTTPLYKAAEEGHLEVVRLLVEFGASKDYGTTNFGATPLYIAAQEGRLEVVRLLVDSGADKDQGTTDDGTTPLYKAAEEGRPRSCPIAGRFWLSDFYMGPDTTGRLRAGVKRVVPHMHCELVTKRVHCVAALRLLQQGHRSFAEKTLKAILRQAQEVCSENQPPEEERHSSFQRPSHGAFSRQALKAQQVFSYQEEATEEASKAKVAEELPGTTGLKAGFLLSTKEVAEAPEERSDAAVGFRWKREHPTVQEVPPVRLESPESTGGYKDEVAPEEVLVYCPKQHALRWEGAPYDMDCDRCGAEISTGPCTTN